MTRQQRHIPITRPKKTRDVYQISRTCVLLNIWNVHSLQFKRLTPDSCQTRPIFGYVPERKKTQTGSTVSHQNMEPPSTVYQLHLAIPWEIIAEAQGSSKVSSSATIFTSIHLTDVFTQDKYPRRPTTTDRTQGSQGGTNNQYSIRNEQYKHIVPATVQLPGTSRCTKGD